MKNLGTKLIEACCGLFETLEGSTPSASESDNYSLTSELITMLSDDLFNCCCCQMVYSYLKITNKRHLLLLYWANSRLYWSVPSHSSKFSTRFGHGARTPIFLNYLKLFFKKTCYALSYAWTASLLGGTIVLNDLSSSLALAAVEVLRDIAQLCGTSKHKAYRTI